MPPSIQRPCVSRIVVLLGIVVLAVAATIPAAGAAKTKINVTVGKTDLVKVGSGPDSFPADVQAKVLAAVRTYVNTATVQALTKGVADPAALATAFDPDAMTKVSGTDRATVTDEGLLKPKGAIKLTVAPIGMSGLFDGDNKIAVVAAKFSEKAAWKSAKGPAKLTRAGELVLTGQADGSWKISEYTLTVTRSGRGLGKPTTTTTTVAGSTTTTGKAAS